MEGLAAKTSIEWNPQLYRMGPPSPTNKDMSTIWLEVRNFTFFSLFSA